jgi:hypothetical protein
MCQEKISPSCKNKCRTIISIVSIRSIGLLVANTTLEIKFLCPIILSTRKCSVPKAALKYKSEAPQKIREDQGKGGVTFQAATGINAYAIKRR